MLTFLFSNLQDALLLVTVFSRLSLDLEDLYTSPTVHSVCLNSCWDSDEINPSQPLTPVVHLTASAFRGKKKRKTSK